jgi:hypothetical protein
LSKNTSLTKLEIAKNSITFAPQTIDLIGKYLKKNVSLVWLDIRSLDPPAVPRDAFDDLEGPPQHTALGPLVKMNRTLRHLNIANHILSLR